MFDSNILNATVQKVESITSFWKTAMSPSIFPAVAALLGSVVGATAGIRNTINQARLQAENQRKNQLIDARRQAFIELDSNARTLLTFSSNKAWLEANFTGTLEKISRATSSVIALFPEKEANSFLGCTDGIIQITKTRLDGNTDKNTEGKMGGNTVEQEKITSLKSNYNEMVALLRPLLQEK